MQLSKSDWSISNSTSISGTKQLWTLHFPCWYWGGVSWLSGNLPNSKSRNPPTCPMCPAVTLLLCVFHWNPGSAWLIKSLSPEIDHMLWGIDSVCEHWCPSDLTQLCARLEFHLLLWKANKCTIMCLLCWNWDASQVRVTLSIKRQENGIPGIWHKINKYFFFSYQQEGYPVLTL